MTVYRFQAHSIEGQHTEEPTINYSTTSTGVSSHKIVDGKESTSTSGVNRAYTRSKEAGVKIGGISVAPHEAEDFIKQLEGEQEEAETESKEEAPLPSESFNQSTNIVLQDLDRGDLSNAINLAVKGELTEDKMIDAVSSLGFSEREGALEVANNLFGSLNEQFDEIADQEGISPKDARNILKVWSNTTESTKAIHDWINTGGADSGRLREAMREAWNAYGKSSNTDLVENLKSEGYEVQATSSGIVIKGNEFSDWTTWREARNVFKA